MLARGLIDVMPLNVILAIILCLSVLRPCHSAKQTELEIITQFKPESCDVVADSGDEVHVHYTSVCACPGKGQGYLDTGVMFDTSHQPNRGPIPFTLGQGRVIKGWEMGIKGMCVGEKRKLIIPSHLAYGKQGHPPVIPSDATLTFETELVSVTKKSGEEFIFRLLRFLALPFAAVVIVYFLYKRIKQQEPKSKKPHHGRGGKKKGN